MPRRRCDKVPLCDYADPLVKDLRRLVPAALKRWDEKAIHDARVATRRLRAALDLVEPMVTAKAVSPLRKTLRRLRRRLGPLRDLDVMIEHLRTMRERPKHGDAAHWLSDQLEDCRKAERRKAQKKRNAPDKWLARLDAWEPLRAEIIALGDGVEARMRSSLRSQWQAFAQQADQLSEQLLNGAGRGPLQRAGSPNLSNLSTVDLPS
ncbi:MAG: CHAD domain-containing protein, partial [Tepidisphaeraceae bacterium]